MDEKVREAIKNAVKRENFAQALNMKLIELEDGHSVVEMIYTPENMNNMYDRAHGGALFGLMMKHLKQPGRPRAPSRWR